MEQVKENNTVKKLLRALLIVAVLGVNVGCDQVSKVMVRQTFEYNEQVSLFNSHFTLTHVENTGAFLSLGNTLPGVVKSLLLTILPLLAICAGIIYVFRKKGFSGWNLVGTCFILGGGIGNIYDRAVYGSVTDFMHIDFGVFETGIFNMADVSIMAGMFMVLAGSFFKRRQVAEPIV